MNRRTFLSRTAVTAAATALPGFAHAAGSPLLAPGSWLVSAAPRVLQVHPLQGSAMNGRWPLLPPGSIGPSRCVPDKRWQPSPRDEPRDSWNFRSGPESDATPVPSPCEVCYSQFPGFRFSDQYLPGLCRVLWRGRDSDALPGQSRPARRAVRLGSCAGPLLAAGVRGPLADAVEPPRPQRRVAVSRTAPLRPPRADRHHRRGPDDPAAVGPGGEVRRRAGRLPLPAVRRHEPVGLLSRTTA